MSQYALSLVAAQFTGSSGYALIHVLPAVRLTVQQASIDAQLPSGTTDSQTALVPECYLTSLFCGWSSL